MFYDAAAVTARDLVRAGRVKEINEVEIQCLYFHISFLGVPFNKVDLQGALTKK